jgi:predicted nuclease of predicted toxin-antitoxin system
MNLILDANISWRLASRLEQHFDSCVHVDRIELPCPASDTEIWNYALRNDLVIVTNDEDFLNFSNVKGFPPKIVLMRTGNQSNNFIEQTLIAHKDDINLFVESEDYGVLELY